jgi:hypothetical protein
VGHATLQQDVGVETQRSDEINYVHWRFDELNQVRTDLKSTHTYIVGDL